MEERFERYIDPEQNRQIPTHEILVSFVKLSPQKVAGFRMFGFLYPNGIWYIPEFSLRSHFPEIFTKDKDKLKEIQQLHRKIICKEDLLRILYNSLGMAYKKYYDTTMFSIESAEMIIKHHKEGKPWERMNVFPTCTREFLKKTEDQPNIEDDLDEIIGGNSDSDSDVEFEDSEMISASSKDVKEVDEEAVSNELREIKKFLLISYSKKSLEEVGITLN